MLNRIRRMWQAVIGYLNVWQQLADANVENVRNYSLVVELQKYRDELIEARDDYERLAGERQERIARLTADAAEHDRDKQELAKARATIGLLETQNETVLSRYRESADRAVTLDFALMCANEKLSRIEAVLNPQPDTLDPASTARIVGFTPVLDTTNCGDE